MIPLVERVARAIADAMGRDFDSSMKDKAEWRNLRGEKAGRYWDVNEPTQDDLLDAAQAAIDEVRK